MILNEQLTQSQKGIDVDIMRVKEIFIHFNSLNVEEKDRSKYNMNTVSTETIIHVRPGYIQQP